MSHQTVALQLPRAPIILKQLIVECDINQVDIADSANVSRTSINLCVNKGYIPPTRPSFIRDVEKYLSGPEVSGRVQPWLQAHGVKLPDIWQPLGQELHRSHPSGYGRRISRAMSGRSTGLVVGIPEIMKCKETEMVSQDTLKHFRLFRNPFVNDIDKSTDIYKSDEHRYIEAAMTDTAKHGGFLAVIGEVGSGKSTMRREVMEQLSKEGNVQIIYPQMIDKTRVNASSICDAIIMDLSEETPKRSLESKARQVKKVLLDRSRAGYQACLILEEAHDLTTQALKYLKRFYELEDGYKKLLGIILFGQTELKHMFNESQHVEMREVIRRVQVAEIRGLNGNLKDYLALKFRRVGGKIDDLMDESAIDTLSRRLTTDEGKGKKAISHAYPLLVNNYVARAMNLACDMGEAKITAEIVEAI